MKKEYTLENFEMDETICTWKYSVDANMNNYDFNGGKILFGFRDSGVDGNSYVLSRINNYGKEGMEKEIKELYMMEFFVEKQHGYFEDTGTIRCKFGTVKVVEN